MPHKSFVVWAIIQKPNQPDWVKDLIILGHSEKDDYIYGTEFKVFMPFFFFFISGQMTIPFDILKKSVLSVFLLFLIKEFEKFNFNSKTSYISFSFQALSLDFSHYFLITQ